MSPSPIRVNRASLRAAVVTLALANGKVELSQEIKAFRVPGPLRLSPMFLRLWCGQEQPTEELVGWLADRGLEIVPGLDAHAGWSVRRPEQQEGLF